MNHLLRSIPLPIPIFYHTTLSKRDFESDTWLILGLTAIIFTVLSSLGIFILCYRRRGHKRRMDRRRMMAAKTRGDYAQLEEAKGDTEEEGVPLEDRAAVPEGSRSNIESPENTPPPPAPPTEPRPLTTSSPPTNHDRGRISPRQSQSQVEPQLGFVDVNLQHPQPHGVYLPPIPSIGRERSPPLSPEYTYEHNYGDEYDGNTNDRLDSHMIRSRSPSPDLNPNLNPNPNPNRGLSVLGRSASMLRPR